MSAQTFTPSPLNVSPAALSKVKSLVDEEGNDNLKLRVFVTGGGCAGFQYGFSFDEDVADDDTVIDKEGVKVLVDSLSYQYLAGAQVDYEEGLQGSRFVVNNPRPAYGCPAAASRN